MLSGKQSLYYSLSKHLLHAVLGFQVHIIYYHIYKHYAKASDDYEINDFL